MTEDGFELQWQVKFLGPFYFTNLLLPMLVQGGMTSHDGRSARVVNVSSIMQYVYCSEQGLKYDKLLEATVPTCCCSYEESANEENTPLEPQPPPPPQEVEKARSCSSSLSPIIFTTSKNRRASINSTNALRWYADSKLAVILWSKELSRLMDNGDPESNPPVISMSLHPGIVPSTNNYRSLHFSRFLALVARVMVKFRSTVFLKEKHKSIAQGAATTVFCALNGRVVAGEHYADCKVSDIVNDSVKNDPDAGRKLWEVSMKQIDHRLQCIMESDQAQR